jgi:aldehyde:ferredoxin oxidoreductase
MECILKILRVDLTKRKVQIEKISYDTIVRFIGGVGIGTKILWEEIDEYVHPFSPENPLIFMAGPLTGTIVPASGKHAVMSKSPLTGILGESIAGGSWGSELRRAGFLGIVIKGKAKRATYLWVHGEDIEIRDASHLWGLDTYKTDEEVCKETDKKAKVSCIGPAGENMVLISSIMHEGRKSRAAARCGLGAVMGSKRLKAIAVKGDSEVFIANEEELRNSINAILDDLKERTIGLSEYGTAGLVEICEYLGDLPIKNWLEGKWEKAEKISGEQLKKMVIGRYSCYRCPIACGRKIQLDLNKYGKVYGKGPEYETLAALGSLCLVHDLKAVVKANELCDRYGLDTVSTGSVVAFAMEASEKGLIEEKIRWGDSDAVLRLIDNICRRRGLGKILGDGVRRASQKLGPLSEEFAVHVKGLEPTMHDPRAYVSLAIGYATGNRGPCHLQAFSHPLERNLSISELGNSKPLDRFAVDGKADLVIKMQNLMCMFDSLLLCKFLMIGGIGPAILTEWLNYVTGLNFDIKTFMMTGERIFNLKRMFNVREGISRKDDILHPRFLTHRKAGGAGGHLPHIGYLLSEYYQKRGWTEMGIPSQEKLEELDLNRDVNSK